MTIDIESKFFLCKQMQLGVNHIYKLFYYLVKEISFDSNIRIIHSFSIFALYIQSDTFESFRT
jgi:hypothetical protein